MAGRLLVVAGMKREARAAARAGVVTLCSGGDVALLARRLDALDAGEVNGVVSFGLAGGLDPTLAPGDLVLGSTVLAGTETHEADGALAVVLQDALKRAGLRCSAGHFAGVDAPVLTATAKAALYRRTGALAVDMESHVAARWAAARGLPFAVLRTISDPADRGLPPLAAGAIAADGGIALGAVVAGLMRSPRQLKALLAAGRDSRFAFAALRAAGPLLRTDYGVSAASAAERIPAA